MKIFKTPHIPDSKARLIVADSRFSFPCGIKVIPTIPISTLPDAVCLHADLQLVHLGKDTVLACPEAYDYYVSALSRYGIKVLCGKTSLGSTYPQDTAYNILRLDDSAYHLKGATDEVALEYFKKNNVKTVNIKQAYSKCATAIISKVAVITSDKGVSTILSNFGIDILLIEEGHISLPGYDYGFIGGACCLISPDTLFVTGSLENHPSKDKICAFCKKHGVNIICGNSPAPTDIGSMVILGGD